MLLPQPEVPGASWEHPRGVFLGSGLAAVRTAPPPWPRPSSPLRPQGTDGAFPPGPTWAAAAPSHCTVGKPVNICGVKRSSRGVARGKHTATFHVSWSVMKRR